LILASGLGVLPADDPLHVRQPAVAIRLHMRMLTAWLASERAALCDQLSAIASHDRLPLMITVTARCFFNAARTSLRTSDAGMSAGTFIGVLKVLA
jgi:hypothetical protein